MQRKKSIVNAKLSVKCVNNEFKTVSIDYVTLYIKSDSRLQSISIVLMYIPEMRSVLFGSAFRKGGGGFAS
jgi:hypothetical protein